MFPFCCFCFLGSSLWNTEVQSWVFRPSRPACLLQYLSFTPLPQCFICCGKLIGSFSFWPSAVGAWAMYSYCTLLYTNIRYSGLTTTHFFFLHPLLSVTTHTHTSMQFDMWPEAKHVSLISLLPSVSPSKLKENCPWCNIQRMQPASTHTRTHAH